MITVYPHNLDWDYVAGLTNDKSWSSGNMRKYFQRLENCHHRPGQRLLHSLGLNPTKHGFDGWLQTEAAIPLRALAGDKVLIETVLDSAARAFETVGQKAERVKWQFPSKADPTTGVS